MKRTPINRVSQKHAKALAQYRKLRLDYLEINRTCEAGLVLAASGIECGCKTWATEIHHRLKRGKNLNNTESWVPTCSSCHRYIEEHKSVSRELGLLKNIHDC